MGLRLLTSECYIDASSLFAKNYKKVAEYCFRFFHELRLWKYFYRDNMLFNSFENDNIRKSKD